MQKKSATELSVALFNGVTQMKKASAFAYMNAICVKFLVHSS